MDYDKTRIKVFGHGEIGGSLCALFDEKGIKHAWKDKNTRRGHQKCYFLHVAIPYSEHFVDIVDKEIHESGARAVIIHSTVRPGTTKKLAERFPDIEFAHSPVIGVHPNLLDGLKTFKKWVGINKSAPKIQGLMLALFPSARIVFDPEITEKLKLLSTTYYGLCIAFHGEAKKILGDDTHHLKAWTDTYNKGYEKLGMSHVVRPNLYPPDKIGGHCILPNVDILSLDYESKVFDLINEYR